MCQNTESVPCDIGNCHNDWTKEAAIEMWNKRANPSIYTKWESVEKSDAKLPTTGILLCWNKVWLSPPVSFRTQFLADKYKDENGVVAYLLVIDPKPCLKK